MVSFLRVTAEIPPNMVRLQAPGPMSKQQKPCPVPRDGDRRQSYISEKLEFRGNSVEFSGFLARKPVQPCGLHAWPWVFMLVYG